MEIQKYNPKLRDRARELRKHSTFSEIILWNKLRDKKILETRFLRQRPIDNYVVDFYSKELKLAIEVDGSIHQIKKQEDIFRQRQLEAFGIVFLRFTDTDIMKNLSQVIGKIENKITLLKRY